MVGSFIGLESHTDSLINSAPTLMSQGSSLINGTSMMNAAGLIGSFPDNPCELLDDIMGSVLGGANDVINALADQIQPLIAFIGGPLEDLEDAIVAAIGPIADAVSGVADMIFDEIASLSNFLSDFNEFTQANNIIGVSIDPCLQSVLNAIGTPDLIQCLTAGVPGFNVF